jgi:Terminase large subunit, T4likevirus-type, N-terminal/Terminase RNaseH-like domain
VETNQFIDLVIEAGRQLGKSTGLAWLICWYVVRFAARNVYIVAPSLDQARIIYNEVIWQFENTALRYLVKGRPVDFPFPHLALLNGSHVHGRGANSPKYLRGKPVDLLIEDEAAFFKEGIHTHTIEPMFTVSSNKPFTGIIRVSTPFGDGDFSEGVKAAKKDTTGGSKYLHFTSFDNPFANRKKLEEIRERYGEDSLLWRTEYMAESVGSELAVFDPVDIRWAYDAYPYVTEQGTIQYPYPPKKQHDYVQGVDLANRRDYFVSTVLDTTDALAVQVRHDRMQKRGYAVYKSIVRSNAGRYNNAKTLVDATSLGESVVEDLLDIRAEGFRFTGTTAKYDLVHNLVRALNEHRVALPYIPELISELRNFQYEMTAAKNLKMEAKEGHDDYVMSLALAVEKASQPNFTGFFLGGFKGFQPAQYDVTEGVDPFHELFK